MQLVDHREMNFDSKEMILYILANFIPKRIYVLWNSDFEALTAVDRNVSER